MKKLWLSIILVIVSIALIGCKQQLMSNGSEKNNQLEIWVFAEPHKRFYEVVKKEFHKTHPEVHVQIKLMEFQSLTDKYIVAMRSNGQGAPDLIDIEQGNFPNFIRGKVPFEPLNDYLKRDGLEHVMSEGRQALYTVDGVQYGIEHAATVSALYYRKDIYDQAGIDVSSLKTWDQFTEASKKLIGKDKFIFPGTVPGEELSQFELLLRQEGGDIVTPEGKIGMNTNEGLIALKRIQQWEEAGIMDKSSPSGPAFWDTFNKGRYLAAYGADWWANLLVDNTPKLSGKWAAVPMPIGGPKSVPTTVQGGTGLMISKYSNKKELAWEFLKLAQLHPDMSVKRYQVVNLFPALLTAMDKPGLHEQSTYTEYFGGQDLGDVYGSLVEKAPRQNQAWWRPLAAQAWQKFYFDYDKGKYTPEQFLAHVEKELTKLIESEKARAGIE
ncbi:hypothetical protein WQ54_16730 [Bacillus sp. SA1-12]|uniref:ABC transporter substrate-binding protein n=1 Tax=Bacillus sp. SA1-12 TaxID=1455638 RepID=UPI000627101C|nr:extracellular solute-binding protein [Bacillus sp. SA1-12]KKI91097.1 hypothetical protein WQ54_16730 [Bacillus sp. SA1-12]